MNSRTLSRLLWFGLSVLLITSLLGKDYLKESDSDHEDRMEWWKEARFGMFIHWGVYSVLGGTYKGDQVPGIGEWIMHRAAIPVDEYEAYAQMFNPVFFDAEQWVKIAADAGMNLPFGIRRSATGTSWMHRHSNGMF
jgi:alpha-L-fucosidase